MVKPRMLLALMALMAGVCVAQEPDALARATAEAAARIDPATLPALDPEALARTQAEHAALFESLRQQGARAADSALGGPTPAGGPPVDEGRTYRVYVSLAMGRDVVRDVLAMAMADSRIHVVFRGVPPGESARSFLTMLRPWMADGERVATVLIDPPGFRADKVETVPVVVARDGQASVARVSGMSNVAWLAERVEAGRRGDLGVHGTGVAPSELDMQTVLENSIGQYDVDAALPGIKRRFWERQQRSAMPVAREARTRQVDPSVVVSETMRTPDGQVFAQAGQVLNPLSHVAWAYTLYVFDANDPAQRAAVRSMVDALGDGTAPMLIAVRGPDDAGTGFETWAAWQRALGDRRLYLAPEPLVERFRIERVPAVVRRSGMVFEVAEVAIDEQHDAAGNAIQR